MSNFPKKFQKIFLQKNYLNIEKIKVKISQIFLTLISTLKEENKIVPTKNGSWVRIRLILTQNIVGSS